MQNIDAKEKKNEGKIELTRVYNCLIVGMMKRRASK
jgi:hypothetical protein